MYIQTMLCEMLAPGCHLCAMLYVVLETMLFAAAFCTAGDATHFTWWGVLCLLVANMSELLDLPPAICDRIATFAAVVSFNVAISVVGCSSMRCTLFQASLDDVGPYMFIVGNWALHYHPAVRATQRWLHAPATDASPTVTLDAVRVLFAFCLLVAPSSVYGCKISSSALQATGMALAGGVEVVLVALRMSQHNTPC